MEVCCIVELIQSKPTHDSWSPIWRLKNSISNYSGDVLVTAGAFLRRGFAVIHTQSFHLFIQRFLQPWAESACANTVHYLSFKGLMIHHPLFLLAPSKVISSLASHSLIGIQRLRENLSHLLSQVPFKEICHCGRAVYHLLHVPSAQPQDVSTQIGLCALLKDTDTMLFQPLSRNNIYIHASNVVDTKAGRNTLKQGNIRSVSSCVCVCL